MDALKKYEIYFGGSYREQWSDDYSMTVAYSGRRMVEAGFHKGRWIPVGGDEEICALIRDAGEEALLQQFFQASATSYAAIQDCRQRELPLNHLWECLYVKGNPLLGPELLRILMDDCGLSLNAAYHTVASCCDDLRSTAVNMKNMYDIQPRTANLIGILRQTVSTELAVDHDSRLAMCRSPFGAVAFLKGPGLPAHRLIQAGMKLRGLTQRLVIFHAPGRSIVLAEGKAVGENLVHNTPAKPLRRGKAPLINRQTEAAGLIAHKLAGIAAGVRAKPMTAPVGLNPKAVPQGLGLLRSGEAGNIAIADDLHGIALAALIPIDL